MKFSMVLTTRRDIEALKPLFIVSDKDTEIIIIDSCYNELTKKRLTDINHDFYKVTYAPPMTLINKYMVGENTEIVFKRDLVRCHNTGFACAENEWIIKVDDNTELHPDFFNRLRKDIDEIKTQGINKFVLRPVKLEEWCGHEKWDYPVLKELGVPVDKRAILLDREGMGNQLFITLDQAVFTYSSIEELNGNDERYDIGHGYEDVDLMQRFITYGYQIILDQNLITFQKTHKIKADPFPSLSRLLYEINYFDIINGKYYAYNPYSLKDIKQKMFEGKKEYVI